MCARGPYEPHLISSIYRLLHEATPLTESSHSYMSKWSRLLQQPVSLVEWGKIWESSFKVSRCVVQRETTFKILLFWYRTPVILHARNPEASRQCWRCRNDIGTHYHIYGDCPIIKPFWTYDQTLLQNLLNITIPLNPIHYLLGLPNMQGS